MKQRVRPQAPEKLMRTFPITGLVQDWYFRVDEVSSGVYVAEGSDTVGRKVYRKGADPDELLAACVRDATEIRAQIESEKPQGG